MEWLKTDAWAPKSLKYLELAPVQWALLAVLVILIVLVSRLGRPIVVSRVRRIAASTPGGWDDLAATVFARTHVGFVVVLAVYAAVQVFPAVAWVAPALFKVVLVATFVQAGLWSNVLVRHLMRSQIAKHQGVADENSVNLAAHGAVGLTARFILWSVLFIVLLDNLGLDVTTLVTGLGIGGLAIALAVQNVLGDIFASLSIVLDRPFEIGDFVMVGDKVGTVESIGLKTSRIRSLSGEQLVYPNKTLVETTLQNYRSLQTRRVVFGFGVLYETPLEQLREIPTTVRTIVEGVEKARFDRAHFHAYGDSSLDFEVVYFVEVPDFESYMDAQQEINLKLFEQFGKAGIGFAYPTRTLIVRQEAAASA